jgi:hypothetical protein
MFNKKSKLFEFLVIFLLVQLLSNTTLGQTRTGKYLRTEASEFWENLGGDIGMAHLQDVYIVFLSNGKEVSYSVCGEGDYCPDVFKIAQNKFSAFWAKKPNSKTAGAHGATYDYTNYSNVGKRFTLNFKKKQILISYKKIN